MFFWDESGFRADTVHGKTWGRRGQTPVIKRPGQRQSISAASAVNARGGFWFCTYAGALNADRFVDLRRQMMARRLNSMYFVILFPRQPSLIFEVDTEANHIGRTAVFVVAGVIYMLEIGC